MLEIPCVADHGSLVANSQQPCLPNPPAIGLCTGYQVAAKCLAISARGPWPSLWAERNSICLEARYIPGKRNILADQISHPDQILPREWSLLPSVFNRFCRVFGCPHLDLFVTRASNKFPLYVSLVPDPLAWIQDALHLPLDLLVTYAFPPFALLCQVITLVMVSLILVAPLCTQREWFVDLLDLFVAEPLKLPRVWNLLVQPPIRRYHRGLETLWLHAWILSSDLSERLAFCRRL